MQDPQPVRTMQTTTAQPPVQMMSAPPVRKRTWSAFLVFAFLSCLLLCGCSSARQPAQPDTIRVLTYNIHHGEGLDKMVDMERIADLIKKEGADIVGLQEVDKGVKRTNGRDLSAELARLTGMTCVFSNNFHFQGGEYGNAVLTRFPVLNWTNRHYKMLRPDEQRGALRLNLKVRGKDFVFIDTHIDFRPDDTERLMNVEEMKELITEAGGKPLVLCGDFNCTPDSRPHQALAEVLTDAWTVAGVGEGFTIPAGKPTKRIDFIWVSKQLTPLRVWVPVSEASDHRPVVAELALPN